MTRWKASALHLLVSLTVIGSITGLIYLLWFPHALILIAGMDRLLATMLLVDIVAGPLLTLIVFKAHDMPQTRRDLAVIGLLQAGFLVYALHTAWVSRPVFLVWSVDKMYLMYANDFDAEDLADAGDSPAGRPAWFGPKRFAVDLPAEHDARAEVFTDIIQRQTSLERVPKYYGSYDAQRARMLKFALPAEPESLPAWMPPDSLRSAVAASGRPASELRLVPIESARAASMLLIDAQTAEPVRTLAPPPAEADTPDGASSPQPNAKD